MGDRSPPPKRPLTAFFLYIGDRRNKLKAEQPELAAKQLTTKMGEEWHAMDEDTKAEYQMKVASEKALYDDKIKAYTERYPNWRKEEKDKKKEKKVVSAGGIKKKKANSALSGFNVFTMAIRLQYQNETGKKMAFGEQGMISKMWKSMTEETQKNWGARAADVNKEVDAAVKATVDSGAESE